MWNCELKVEVSTYLFSQDVYLHKLFIISTNKVISVNIHARNLLVAFNMAYQSILEEVQTQLYMHMLVMY
jgi:hypothetical protein